MNHVVVEWPLTCPLQWRGRAVRLILKNVWLKQGGWKGTWKFEFVSVSIQIFQKKKIRLLGHTNFLHIFLCFIIKSKRWRRIFTSPKKDLYSKSLSWAENLNFLPITVNNLFKFSAQDRDLEYCKNPAVSSDKKPPLCHMTYDSIHIFYERFLLVLYLLFG